MTDALNKLRTLVTSVVALPEEDWVAFSAIWTPFTAKRKEIITFAGERELHLYFVLSGVQRVFYYDEMDREATLVFTYAPSFGGVLDALLLENSSKYNYETLSPSTFLKADFHELKALTATRPAVEKLIRIGVTQALSGVMERLVEIQSFSSEEKFKRLLERSPHILQLVPHKYLANYLGIDATNFSKLINRVKI
jgi:CRP-like cAMP-binding protein